MLQLLCVQKLPRRRLFPTIPAAFAPIRQLGSTSHTAPRRPPSPSWRACGSANKQMMKVTSLQPIVFVIAVSFTLGHVPS